MAKTNAQRQREYRERKKAQRGTNYLEKERKRQKKYYVKVKDLPKKDLEERREAVRMRVRKYRQAEFNESISQTPEDSTTKENTTPLLVAMSFPKKGESSRKRRLSREKRLYKKVARLEKEKEDLAKRNASLRVQIHRVKNKQKKDETQTPKRSSYQLLRQNGITPNKATDGIKKALLFSEVISSEIREAVNEKKNKRLSINRFVGGKVLRKYKLIKYASTKTGTKRRKLNKVSSKVLNVPTKKRGFDQMVFKEVIEFYNRDDVSTALPGKKDAKSVKKKKIRVRIQKRNLNDYLSNLYQKLMVEKPDLKLSFTNFTRMRPANIMLANFCNRRSCLCTQHQNLALKLKMLKGHCKTVPTNPDVFRKLFADDEAVTDIFKNSNAKEFTFDEWKKVPVMVKSKSGEDKTVNKTKIVRKTMERAAFIELFSNDVVKFRDHAHRIKIQYLAQRTLKENLKPNHVYIHMDFAEDYRCRSQEEIQSAYWSQTQVTIHPVVGYFKRGDKLVHQSFVFVSDEPRHDAKFVYALSEKLVPSLLSILPGLKFIHYWTDSPTSQYRNKTIFKVNSCHEEYFNVRATWSYMEAGHGKGPCDPIGGTAKRKADLAVKNDKAIIQDALDFFNWAKEEESSAIKFYFLSTNDYENAASFLATSTKDLVTVPGTMKVHAVMPEAPNKIWIRDVSCFNDCCYRESLQEGNKCNGWRLVDLKKNRSEQCETYVTNDVEVKDAVIPEIGDYVASVYIEDRKVYVGVVTEIKEGDANVKFLKHNGEITNATIFYESNRGDEALVEFENILCVLPAPTVTKRGRKFDQSVISMINARMNEWKMK